MENLRIETERLYLRCVSIEDTSMITFWKSDTYIKKMALDPWAEVTLESQFNDISHALKSERQIYLLICHKDNGRPLGYIRADWLDEPKKFAWFRLAFGEERGKGYAGEAARAFLAYLFETGTFRIEGEVYEFNNSSRRLIEKLGFVREGVKRKAHFDGTEYSDVYVYGLLEEDFDY